MARIGSRPVPLSDEVDVHVDANNVVTVTGPKGELTQEMDPAMVIEVSDDQVVVDRPTNQRRHRAVHGLTRSLIDNMVTGVVEGYEKKLTIIGVGYRAQMGNNGVLELALGFSHPIFFVPPDEVDLSVDTSGKQPVITVQGVDKQLVGQVAAKIRDLRPPEPYNGKGVRYVGEDIKLKAGKTAAR